MENTNFNLLTFDVYKQNLKELEDAMSEISRKLPPEGYNSVMNEISIVFNRIGRMSYYIIDKTAENDLLTQNELS